jgi:7-keto-8-aminopelargonate synthetase-like enzyme
MARRRGLDPAPTLTKLWQGLGVRIGWRGMAAGAVGGLISGAALVLVDKIITRVLPGTLAATLHPPSAASALAASTAAALGEETRLARERLVLSGMHLRSLAECFDVNPQAMAIRLITLGLVRTQNAA